MTCNSNRTRVVGIHLPGVGLTGSIPENSIGKLDALKILSRHSNGLKGNLPSNILSLPSLQLAHLQHNNFSGPTPSSVSPELIAMDHYLIICAHCIFKGLYIHSRFTINPDKVHRMAMRRLNPLSGTDLRAYVMSGGGITLKKLKPSFRSRRCFLIFPIRGSDRKGLVSVEVKKKKGQYDMKLLAVDVTMASCPDQRLYIIGDEEEYRIGGGLISELRDPVVKAMAASKEFDDLDEIEEKEDAEKERQEAERKQREKIEKLENSGTQ